MASKRRLQHWPPAEISLVGMLPDGRGPNDSRATIDQLVAEMSQRVEAITLAEAKTGFIPRFNQPKTVGLPRRQNFGCMRICPHELKHGLFSQPASYPAMLRFANASNMDDSKKDIRGLSIKVSNVKRPRLSGVNPACRILCSTAILRFLSPRRKIF